jgi:hypothetical protein
MNTRLLTVSKTKSAVSPTPRISFFGDWLSDIGFVPGALVQVVPVPGGVDFRLCDENIGRYSELFSRTREMGGTLRRVYLGEAKSHHGPAFVAAGSYIYTGGLAMGDTLIAGYDFGIIKARKVDTQGLGFENLRIVAVSHLSRKHSQGPIPKIRICGYWLADIGFGIGAFATASAGPGVVELSLAGADKGYSAVMKYVRGRGMKIVQVGKDPHDRGEPRPYIFISGSSISKAGFETGDTLVCSYGQGLIKFQALDFKKLGFC